MHLRAAFILLVLSIGAETIVVLGGMLKHLSNLIQMQGIYIAIAACGELRAEPGRGGILVEVRSHIKSSLLGRSLQKDFLFKHQDGDNTGYKKWRCCVGDS